MNARTLLFGAVASLTFSITTLEAADWPQWRGPDRTGLSSEKGLLKAWPEGGPKQVWIFKNAGDGYSSPAIVAGKLYTMGTRNDEEILIALNVANGSELWIAPMGPVRRDDRGHGPRGTPTVDGDRLYGLSGRGDLVCAQIADGKVLWKKTMSELGGRVPSWGFAESVLVDGDNVICTPGGPQGTIAALDKKTGTVRWQTTELTDFAAHPSIIPATHNGVRQYIQLTKQTLAGVAPKDGKVLWKAPFPGGSVPAVIPTPIYGDGHVFATAGYRVGCELVKIADNSSGASIVYENKTMQNQHGGGVLVEGRIFGHSDSAGWLCLNFKTGEQVWASRNFGKGAVTYADGMLYCVEENRGTVALVEASAKGWTEKGRFTPEPRTTIRTRDNKVWTHPVVSNGKLFLRDQDLIYCYDVKG
ncbi:MAG: polyvinylalcohol dehydrogenase [Verrucomicrobia bacterium]|nr:polyvinylalcohol dehydrogenase [Verrucomicrobiota bacterium]